MDYIFAAKEGSDKAYKIPISINSYSFINFCIENSDIIRKYSNSDLNSFLGFSDREIENFTKWFNRKVKPYCSANGINWDNYPIKPPLLLEISKLEKVNYDDIIQYFEYYLYSYTTFVTKDYLEFVANDFKIKESSLDLKLMSTILDNNPTKLKEYKEGKVNLINFFFGEYLKSLKNKNIDKNQLKLDIENYLNQ